MATAIELSESARCLLTRRLGGERVEVTPGNLETSKELIRTGLAIPVSGFAGGPEAHFRLTKEACELREDCSEQPATAGTS